MSRNLSLADLPMSPAVRALNAHLLQPAAPPVAALSRHSSKSGGGKGMAAAKAAAAEKRLRQSPKPLMNANEAAFARHLADTLPAAILWPPQGITLRLANGVRYIPDFVTYEPTNHGRLVAWEVKGTRKIFDGAGEKLKIAANVYRGMTFYLVWFADHQWHQQHILPEC